MPPHKSKGHSIDLPPLSLQPNALSDDATIVAAEERRILGAWMGQHVVHWRVSNARTAAIFCTVTFLLTWLIEPSKFITIARWLLCLLTGENLVFLALSRRLPSRVVERVSLAHGLLVTLLILGGGYIAVATATQTGDFVAGQVALVFLAYLAGAQQISGLFGTFSIVSVIGFAAHIALGLVLWLVMKLDHLPTWLLLIFALDAYFFSINIAGFTGLKDLGLSSLRTQALRLKNERLKLEAIEADINLARRLKESCAPTNEAITAGPFEIVCSYQPNAMLGGDWLAVQRFADDSFAVALASIEGSGIPAAMVVQSLQALWVDLPETNFEPLGWLKQVNHTMLKMGLQKPHRMSIALLHLHGDRYSFYSAGHGPLFLLSDRNVPASLRLIYGSGQGLGATTELGLSPRSEELPVHSNFAFVITNNHDLTRAMTSSKTELARKITEAAGADSGSASGAVSAAATQILVRHSRATTKDLAKRAAS